jgi:hypothetical protein
VTFLEKRPAGRVIDAAFFAAEDGQLRVQVPDELNDDGAAEGGLACGFSLVVVASKGTTFTVGPGEIRKISPTKTDGFPYDTFRWFEAGGWGVSGSWCLAESGSTVTDSSRAFALFVKQGAKVTANFPPKTFVCVEAAAMPAAQAAMGQRADRPVLLSTMTIAPSIVDFRVLRPDE